MNLNEIDESKLNQLIIMEEFRLWDAKRNNVPESILNEIKLAIKKLKETKNKKVTSQFQKTGR